MTKTYRQYCPEDGKARLPSQSILSGHYARLLLDQLAKNDAEGWPWLAASVERGMVSYALRYCFDQGGHGRNKSGGIVLVCRFEHPQHLAEPQTYEYYLSPGRKSQRETLISKAVARFERRIASMQGKLASILRLFDLAEKAKTLPGFAEFIEGKLAECGTDCYPQMTETQASRWYAVITEWYQQNRPTGQDGK